MKKFKKRTPGFRTFVTMAVALFLFVSGPTWGQSTSTAKKALDAFINATTKSQPGLEPVAGARVVISISGKSRQLKTDEYGVFGIETEKPEQVFGQAASVPVALLVTTEPPFPRHFFNYGLSVNLNRSEGPLYAFAIMYDKNRDSLLILKVPVNLILAQGSPDKSKKEPQKKDSSKEGKAYVCQVGHF